MTTFSDFLSHFQKFIDDNKLKEEDKISNLSSQKLAISGSLFLKKLLPQFPINPCKGPNYSQLFQQIQNFNTIFLNNNIRYMVIFHGLSDFEYNHYIEYKANLRTTIREMWKSLIKMEYDQSFSQIKTLYPFYYMNLKWILTILDEIGIEYMISPYNESSQIRRLYSNEYINAIAADLDFLAFSQGLSNFTNIIFDFDLETNRFFWVDYKKLLSKLQITNEQINEFFLLAGIMNGNSLLKSKEINNETNIFQTILIAERKKENITNLIDSDSLSIYHTQRKKLENMPILTALCEIEIYNIAKEFPEKMKDFFGSFLPLQIYLFLSFNLLPKNLVFALSKARIFSTIPIADSIELRNLLENEFLALYKKIFGILTVTLSNSYKKQTFSFYKYFEVKDKPIIFSIQPCVISKLFPNANFIDKIKEKHRLNGFSFIHSIQVFIGLILSEKNEKNDNISHSSPNSSPNFSLKERNPIENKEFLIEHPSNFEEIACYSQIFFLQTLEYMNIDTKEISILGLGLRKSTEPSEESLIIILELMKSSVNHLYGRPICDAVKLRKLSVEASPGLKNRFLDKGLIDEDKIKEEFNLNAFLNVLESAKDEEKESLITCISRIFAFISPSTQYTKLKNVYDYDLSQYLAILQYQQNLLSDLWEAILFEVFISGEKKEKNYLKFFFEDAKKKINKRFKRCFNIDLAIAVKLVLLMKDYKDLEAFCGGDEKVLVCLKKDFEKGVELWDEIVNLLKYQEKKGVFNQELNGLFYKADELLKNKLKELKIL